MTKSPKQLQREIDAMLAIAPMMSKWRRGIAAYNKAIVTLRAGGDEQDVRVARERLHKLIHEAAKYAPLSYRDPEVEKLNAEYAALASFSDAIDAGRSARAKIYRDQADGLRQQEREDARNSPTYWMRK